ncbi:MAG TPA: pantoate--beta-alanine ligase [Geobacteraceae bacterium]|nr:pantoate--beta-alanine ligase [Geobacteraceae bacterium]
MQIITNLKEMREKAREARAGGKTIAFVPTMGFLHEGHASLLREGRRRGDVLVLSIFVNPTQFGAGEDYETYPRSLERDAAVARETGVDIIFAPDSREMYPEGYQTFVNVDQLTLPLCGASRPGHFRGVTTVVAKLLNIVTPHTALFGEKDFQQLAVIRRMVADLNMDVEIVGMPIVREADGLAMSSRNSYLSREERKSASCLNRSLAAVAYNYGRGVTSSGLLREKVMEILAAEPSAVVEYVDFRHKDTLEPVERVSDDTLLALAVRIGKTRLIDNMIVGRGFPCREKC